MYNQVVLRLLTATEDTGCTVGMIMYHTRRQQNANQSCLLQQAVDQWVKTQAYGLVADLYIVNDDTLQPLVEACDWDSHWKLNMKEFVLIRTVTGDILA